MAEPTVAAIRRVLNDPASDAPGDRVYRRDWDQNCQALMYQLARLLGTAAQVYPSAKSAMNASGPLNPDPHAAPPGSFHYWGMGRDGHVAYSLGGELCVMGSTRVPAAGLIARNAGVTTVSAYAGADYRGWALFNGRNAIPFVPEASDGIVVLYGGDDWDWAEPTGDLAKRVQAALAARERYNYPDGSPRPVDGVFGRYTREGVQITLGHSGVFESKIDGDPRRGCAYGVQDYGKQFGDYAGKRDGRPRVLSWTAFALGLERD